MILSYQAVIWKKNPAALFCNLNQFDRGDAGITAPVWILSKKLLRTRYFVTILVVSHQSTAKRRKVTGDWRADHWHLRSNIDAERHVHREDVYTKLSKTEKTGSSIALEKKTHDSLQLPLPVRVKLRTPRFIRLLAVWGNSSHGLGGASGIDHDVIAAAGETSARHGPLSTSSTRHVGRRNQPGRMAGFFFRVSDSNQPLTPEPPLLV